MTKHHAVFWLMLLPLIVAAQEPAPIEEEPASDGESATSVEQAAEPAEPVVGPTVGPVVGPVGASVKTGGWNDFHLRLGLETGLVSFGPSISASWALARRQYLGCSLLGLFAIGYNISLFAITADYDLFLGDVVYFNPGLGLGFAFVGADGEFGAGLVSKLKLGLGVAFNDQVGLELRADGLYIADAVFGLAFGLDLSLFL